MVDQLLRQSGTLQQVDSERVMDSGDIEKERGITILAKNTGFTYQGYSVNLVDTPGHTDFGGEVERTLQQVEGFLLLIDAAEGVLPGTRFVLQKALQLKLDPIVVINKIDRPDAAIEATEAQVSDLFLDLAIEDSQLDFPLLYGSSRFGFVSKDPEARSGDMQPLFEAIINHIRPPVEQENYLQFLVTSLDYSDFLGVLGIGRVFNGEMAVGDLVVCSKDGVQSKPMRLTKIFTFVGLSRVEVEKASFGDIVVVAGFSDNLSIGTTVCSPDAVVPYPYVSIDEPTLSLYMSVNNSPFNGRDGNLLTSRQIRARLDKELKVNVALKVEDTSSPEVFKISGRGQLHLGILAETMRREGFEFQLSSPEVIYKTIDGVKQEPIELVVIDVPSEYQGAVMENLCQRKGELQHMHVYADDRIRLEFKVPSRALLGFRSQFLTETRGTGLVTMSFHGYEPYKGDVAVRVKGALISMEAGMATGYALDNLQVRGVLFIRPGDEVYEGMIIGENSRNMDMDVNPCKAKKLTNMRASGTDEAIKLTPPYVMTLEQCMEWIRPDELIEVTPHHIRLRKKTLRAGMRKKD